MNRIFLFSILSGFILFLSFFKCDKKNVYQFFKIYIYFLLYFSISIMSSLFFKDAHGCNWIGRLSCILVSLAICRLENIPVSEVGFKLPNGRAGYLWTVVGIALAVFYTSAETVLFGVIVNHDFDNMAYQATMPGLDEEFFFRGVSFVLLLNVFSNDLEKNHRWVVPALVVSALFFLAHAAPSSANFFSFSFLVPFQIFVPTVLLIWIRLRTKSLLGPILAHNATNLTPMIISML